MTYVVANPRGQPKGALICGVDGKQYYEGDVYTGPLVTWISPKHTVAQLRDMARVVGLSVTGLTGDQIKELLKDAPHRLVYQGFVVEAPDD